MARIKPLPDTAVICSENVFFYLLTVDTCKRFLLPGAFNKNLLFSAGQDMVLLALL